MKNMKIVFWGLGAILLLSCDPFGDTYSSLEEAIDYRAKNLTEANAEWPLKVMTWNIKFGGGRIDFWFDCYGDRVLMTETEVEDNMEALVEYIVETAPDILLLQEADVNAKRSAYFDQVQYILDQTELNYAVYASQWQNQYIPSDGLGPMDSGNAILSRWELTDAERIELPLRDDQDALTQHFYLKRNILKARTLHPDFADGLWVLNVHTAAFSKDGTKKEQLDIFKEELDALDADGKIFVAGGDLNEIPPDSEQTSGFPDSVCEDEDFIADDYSEETEWIREFYNNNYSAAIPLLDYEADNEAHYSHTTNGNGFWTRKLDYLFSNIEGGFSNGVTHQNTMQLSDHAPVSAEINLSE